MRKIIIIISFLFSLIYSDIAGDIRVCAIRIEFNTDTLESTTGDGKFLVNNEGIDCGKYIIDSAPHNRSYFESQLKAVNNYYRNISNEKFGFDLDNSNVFPVNEEGAYQLEYTMDYYNPYGSNIEKEQSLTMLFKDALVNAYIIDSINFDQYDMIVVFHAGIGQDFSLPFLDPTPEDIPSTYIDNQMIQNYIATEGLIIGGAMISKGIILPETQNHLLYEISLDMFNTSEPCEYQYGLTGTFALMVGFFIGLPPLWNINNGESGVGVFGLMDQGSNNGRGLIPSKPTAWTRIYAGWEEASYIPYNSQVTLYDKSSNQIAKVDINDSEYFLIENRNNYVYKNVSLDSMSYKNYEKSGNSRYPPLIEILFDSVEIEKDINDVVINIPNYDLGLPSSGLLIWHIDEAVIESEFSNYTINADINRLGIDIEEADGAQDIGKESFFIFNNPSAGYFGDMWFKGNLEYERANPSYEGSNIDFGPFTYPNTNDNYGYKSGITIGDIGGPSDTMTFVVTHDYIMEGFPDSTAFIRAAVDFNNDGLNEIIGGKDSLWWSPSTNISSRKFIMDLESNSKDIFMGFGINSDTTFFEVREFLQNSVKITKLYYIHQIQEFIIDHIIYEEDFSITIFENFYGDVDTITISEWESHTRRVFFNSIFNYMIPPTGYGISINNFNNQPTKYTDKRFTYLAGVDLNLDGTLDLLALDNEGYLHAFNSDLIAMAEFPLETKLKEPILAGDILGNSFPEIIAKSLDGKNINIYNHQGVIIDRFISPGKEDLVCLGLVNDYTSIISDHSIYNIEEKGIFSSNSWKYVHGSLGRNRTVILDQEPITNNYNLFIRGYCYPNPIIDDLGTIRIETNNAKEILVKIYDYAGYFVNEFRRQNIAPGIKINEWIWNVSSIDPGVYFGEVSIKSDTNIKSDIIKIAIIK